MAVYTTLEETKRITRETVQGGLDLVREHYLNKENVDAELSTESTNPAENKVVTTELQKKVSVEVIGNNLIFK